MWITFPSVSFVSNPIFHAQDNWDDEEEEKAVKENKPGENQIARQHRTTNQADNNLRLLSWQINVSISQLYNNSQVPFILHLSSRIKRNKGVRKEKLIGKIKGKERRQEVNQDEVSCFRSVISNFVCVFFALFWNKNWVHSVEARLGFLHDLSTIMLWMVAVWHKGEASHSWPMDIMLGTNLHATYMQLTCNLHAEEATKGKKCPKQAGTDAAVQAQSIAREYTQPLLMSMNHQLQAVIAWKWEGLCKRGSGISNWFMWYGWKYPQIIADCLLLNNFIVSFQTRCQSTEPK